MTKNPIKKIDHPAAWYVDELGDAERIALHLETRHLEALGAAVRRSKKDAHHTGRCGDHS